MSLDRFQNFQASAAQSASNGDPAHVRVEEHGAPASNRPSYVRRFLRKAWGVALVGTRLDVAAHRVRTVATGLAQALPFKPRTP